MRPPLVCALGASLLSCFPAEAPPAPPVGATFLDTVTFCGSDPEGEPVLLFASLRRWQRDPSHAEREAKLWLSREDALSLTLSQRDELPSLSPGEARAGPLSLQEGPCPDQSLGCLSLVSSGASPLRLTGTAPPHFLPQQMPQARAALAMTPAVLERGARIPGVAVWERVAALSPAPGPYFGTLDAFVLCREREALFLSDSNRLGSFWMSLDGRHGTDASLSWGEVFTETKTGRPAPSSWVVSVPSLGLSGRAEAHGGHLSRGKIAPSGKAELFAHSLLRATLRDAQGERSFWGLVRHVQDQ